MELATRTEASNSYSQDSCDESSGDPMPAPSTPSACPPSSPLNDVPYCSTSTHRSTLTWLVIYLAVSFTTTCFHILASIYICKTVNIYFVLFLVLFGLIINGSLFYGVVTRNVLVLRIHKIVTNIIGILYFFCALVLLNLLIGFIVLGELREFQIYLEEHFPGYQWSNVMKTFLLLFWLGLLVGIELQLRSYVINKSIRVIQAETQQLQSKNPPINV